MSEQLRHKMIVYEATPPPAAWEAIAAKLGDNLQYAAVAGKMHQFEEAPPPAVWDTIASRLNDDTQYAAVATKMNNFEAAPPPLLWNNIAAALQDTKEVTVPVFSMRKALYRVAVAAVITALIIGGWLVMNNKKMVRIETASKRNNTAPVQVAGKKNNAGSNMAATDSNRESVALHQEQRFQNNATKHASIAAALDNDNEGPVLKHAFVHNLLAYQERPIVISSAPILDKEGNVIRDMDILTTSNYLVVTGPNGQSTRISSKFASVIRYLNGTNDSDPQEYLDRVIIESDTWKKRFQEWRNKISQSSFIPSAANFLDIIEFKEMIQEKQ